MSTAEPIARRVTGVAHPMLLKVAQVLIWVYQTTISPYLGPGCRFAPSCSAYASQALGRYGLMRGGWMAVRRILRCHPFHAGGWDPVR